MSVVAVPVDDPDAAVELPVAPAVPALETDELDCGEVAGLVEAGAALVSVEMPTGHTGVLPVGVAGRWTVVGGTWQLDALFVGAVAALDAGVLLAAAGPVAV